mmetsp:Transcript_16887/g.29242  ORF Transcript_16887/g.29242 Transcript_16887/m.29242 type:complete len:335 (+) Transcript_16887:1993-2997(+)
MDGPTAHLTMCARPHGLRSWSSPSPACPATTTPSSASAVPSCPAGRSSGWASRASSSRTPPSWSLTRPRALWTRRRSRRLCNRSRSCQRSGRQSSWRTDYQQLRTRTPSSCWTTAGCGRWVRTHTSWPTRSRGMQGCGGNKPLSSARMASLVSMEGAHRWARTLQVGRRSNRARRMCLQCRAAFIGGGAACIATAAAHDLTIPLGARAVGQSHVAYLVALSSVHAMLFHAASAKSLPASLHPLPCPSGILAPPSIRLYSSPLHASAPRNLPPPPPPFFLSLKESLTAGWSLPCWDSVPQFFLRSWQLAIEHLQRFHVEVYMCKGFVRSCATRCT